MSTPPLSLCIVLSESKRIIKAHSRHFLALSVLFLLPMSFSVIVYPILRQLLLQLTTHNSKALLRYTFYQPTTSPTLEKQNLVLTVLYSFFVFVLSLCATGSITYSVFHGFYGRPVKFISAIKSILTSFLPLFVTTILCEIIVSGILVSFAILLILVFKLVKLDGFDQFEYSSPYFVACVLLLLIVLVVILFYLQVNWALVSVVVVVESSWGLKTLKRSAYLIKGYKLVALSLSLCFLLIGILIWSSSDLIAPFVSVSRGWSWASVLQIVIASALLTLLLLYNIAATTVLYMYCKAIHGELASEIAEEFAKEYVSLPFDDGKVPHLVSVSYDGY